LTEHASGRIRFLGSGDSFGSGGRFQTCILAELGARRLLLDCGASSLIAMRAQHIDPNSVDGIVLTHMHGDHCAGVPFLLMDAMLGSKRASRLTIAGPPGLEATLSTLREALFPGSHVMTPKFEVEYVELAPYSERIVAEATVIAYPAIHTPETRPSMVRLAFGGRVVTYTGDTDWSEDLIIASKDADILISECYFYDKPVKMHMNYVTLKRQMPRLTAKRIVLTHMSPQMLARAHEIPESCAHDGMVVEL
jgi:ribonuclease BN (tRNA processing enzyme)